MRQKITLWCLLAILFSSCDRKQNTAEVMNQRLSIITIGTDSLQAMRNFYIQKFGWKPVAENKDIVFFKLNGFLLGCTRVKSWRILQALRP